MNQHPHHVAHQHRVTALFGDHEQTFDLLPGTTLIQLAERLADLAKQNHGWPMGITVVFDPAVKPAVRAWCRQTQGAVRAGQIR